MKRSLKKLRKLGEFKVFEKSNLYLLAFHFYFMHLMFISQTLILAITNQFIYLAAFMTEQRLTKLI